MTTKDLSKNRTSALQGASKESVKKWMRKMVTDFVDKKTNEADATGLAEGAADEFASDKWLDDPDHWVWEIAAEVAEDYDRKNKKASSPSAERVLARFSERSGKTATSPDQWERGAELIEMGASGGVSRVVSRSIQRLEAQLGSIDKSFAEASRILESHKRLGVGRTESPALLLSPLREMKDLSRSVLEVSKTIDRMIEGALRETGGRESDL